LISIDSNLIGVIAPYRQQCVKIRQLLNKVGYGGVEVKVTEDWQGQVRKITKFLNDQCNSCLVEGKTSHHHLYREE
jgi:hypothetical protein